MVLCVNEARMPRAEFLKDFLRSETSIAWVNRRIKGRHAYSDALRVRKDEIVRVQKKLKAITHETGLSISEIKDINRRMSLGEAKARRAKEGHGGGEPPARDLHRQEVHQPRPAVPGPHPGGQHRPDEGRGQVRVPARLQVLDLRDVVDPPGDHALDSPIRRARSASRST